MQFLPPFDTNSFEIAIDNCCSTCITNSLDDFIGTPTKIDKPVVGIGGTATIAYQGTIQWDIIDDLGAKHRFSIPNAMYQESAPYRLLSLQHLAQAYNDIGGGTGCLTSGQYVTLFWDKKRYKQTIPLQKRSNIAVMQSAPGFNGLHSFMSIHDPTRHLGMTSVAPDTDFTTVPAVSPSNPSKASEGGLFKDDHFTDVTSAPSGSSATNNLLQ